MIYTFHCFEDEDGCSHTFEIIMTPSTYTNKQTCPNCKKRISVHRLYEADPINGQVRLADSELKTVGHVAERNTEKMSDEQKYEIWFKNNKYKMKKDEKDLPSGVKRLPIKDGKYCFEDKKELTVEEKIQRSKELKQKAIDKAKEIKNERGPTPSSSKRKIRVVE